MFDEISIHRRDSNLKGVVRDNSDKGGDRSFSVGESYIGEGIIYNKEDKNHG